MDIMINGQNYPITGIVEDEALGPVPIIDLHVMSDYEWHVSCLKSRLENPDMYRRVLGEDVDSLGEDVDSVIAKLQAAIAKCREAVAV